MYILVLTKYFTLLIINNFSVDFYMALKVLYHISEE